jgi:hypothetical protein
MKQGGRNPRFCSAARLLYLRLLTCTLPSLPPYLPFICVVNCATLFCHWSVVNILNYGLTGLKHSSNQDICFFWKISDWLNVHRTAYQNYCIQELQNVLNNNLGSRLFILHFNNVL